MSRDLRKYARDTSVQLGVGAFLLFFLIGIGLIYFIYGSGAAMFGFLCLLATLFPIVLILIFLAITEWITKRANRD